MNSKIKIIKNNQIKLPYLEKEQFIKLMRLGLGYEKGFFFIKDFNKVEEITEALSELLKDEVIFPQICVICEKEFLCFDCRFYETCPSRNLPFKCICSKCSTEEHTYERYIVNFRSE